jgi:hypothetical protein
MESRLTALGVPEVDLVDHVAACCDDVWGECVNQGTRHNKESANVRSDRSDAAPGCHHSVGRDLWDLQGRGTVPPNWRSA